MAQAPIMPLFTDALIGDTTHLSTEQFGAYVLILIATWRNNGKALPDDDEQLAHVCRAGVKRWRTKLRPLVSQFFTVNGSGWHQKRLEAEWLRVNGILAKRRTSASAGGKAAAASRRKSNREATHNQREASLPHQDSNSIDKPESDAAREGKKITIRNPQARCARLGGAVAPPLKTPALKAKIKEQARRKHQRFLVATAPDQLGDYWVALVDDDPAVAQRMFDAIDKRMRDAGWDDMREWKRQHGIAA